jgi:uncharacterized tellurite resistance protein B-like protein
MEILGLIALIVLIWIVAKARKPPSRLSTATRDLTRGAVNVPSAAECQVRKKSARPEPAPPREDTPLRKSTVMADECWLPVGRNTTIAGYPIAGGLLYVGSGLRSVSDVRIEPALIDPSLRVSRSSPDRTGASMTYWPSYGSISPEARAAYLEWLADGRQDATAYIGYVFLYFYGLERRALAEVPRSTAAQEDLPAITREVERLLQIYGANRSFQGYASRLLDILRVLGSDEAVLTPPTERTGYDLPVSLRFGVGRLVAEGKPIPVDWALCWYLTHPETSVRTPMQRCAREFQELFRIRYARDYGDGLTLKPNRSKLKFTITPASASFGGQVQVAMDVPDIAAVTTPIAKLRQIGETCATDLDAFSRWLGRNPTSPKTIAAIALLPKELAIANQSEEAHGLWNFIRETVAGNDMALCKTDDLLQHCRSFGEGKLAKSEAVLLAQLLEKGGYGIEPDVRFGGAPLSPGGNAVVFKLPDHPSPLASPQYAAATVLLHLAVAISAADGSISSAEEQHLHEHVQRGLGLEQAERVRLSAHLAWLTQSPPSLSGLRKRLEPLDHSQRSTIADFIISVAGADGQISPDEIRTLGKIYPMLGLPADDVYSHVHAMASGASSVAATADAVTVLPAHVSTGFIIPSPTRPVSHVQLDMAAVNAKLAQSAQISAILGDIFTEDEPVSTPPAAVPKPNGKLPSPYAAFLSRLVEQPEWSRGQFEQLASEARLLPDAAIDTLNEAAFEHAGGPVLEGEDPIQVDLAIAKGLL